MTYTNRKVGGIRFIRIGRVQISYCVAKPPRRSLGYMLRRLRGDVC